MIPRQLDVIDEREVGRMTGPPSAKGRATLRDARQGSLSTEGEDLQPFAASVAAGEPTTKRSNSGGRPPQNV